MTMSPTPRAPRSSPLAATRAAPTANPPTPPRSRSRALMTSTGRSPRRPRILIPPSGRPPRRPTTGWGGSPPPPHQDPPPARLTEPEASPPGGGATKKPAYHSAPATGLVTSVSDPDQPGDTIPSQHDPDGHTTAVRYPDGTATTATYNDK